MRILIVFVTLIICSIQDIHSKYIDIRIPFVGSLLYGAMVITKALAHTNNSVIYHSLENIQLTFNMVFMLNLLSSFLPGVFLILFSRKVEGIGEGDGWIILFLGILQGFEIVITTIIAALIIFVIIALLFLFINKIDLKTGIAFVPFILLGYSICIVSKYAAMI